MDEGLISANPATKRRGRGKRAGRSRNRSPEKAVVSPLGALLIAERAALLSGRDDEFVAIILMTYTGQRWGELVGLETDFLRAGGVRVEWQLYELDTGELVRCPPKDDSYRTIDLPGWLADLVLDHVRRTGPQPCPCHGRTYLFRGRGAAPVLSAVTLVDVARHAGVSTGTVSNVLNRPGLVAEATQGRVAAAIAELGFYRVGPGGNRRLTGGATASPPGCSARPPPGGTRRRRPNRPTRCRWSPNRGPACRRGAATRQGGPRRAGCRSHPGSPRTGSGTRTAPSWRSWAPRRCSWTSAWVTSTAPLLRDRQGRAPTRRGSNLSRSSPQLLPDRGPDRSAVAPSRPKLTR